MVIYCDNNQFVRTTDDDSIKPSLNFLAYLLNTHLCFWPLLPRNQSFEQFTTYDHDFPQFPGYIASLLKDIKHGDKGEIR
jgi:hypothetical protein